MPLDQASLDRISPYVSNPDRRVFCLSGLPEEVIAVLFAYYSRSRDDLRTNLARLLADSTLGLSERAAPAASLSHAEDKARAFHEKWVVGYGHASVAEHAVVHLAVEGVSIVASKVIEDLRLGSYTEKSTRYVVFDTGSFADLAELPEQMHAEYRASCANLFRTYLDLFPVVEDRLRHRLPKEQGATKAAQASIRAHTCDLLRGLLPASTLTNLGITANARALAMLLSKMMSSPLHEVRAIADEMHAEARSVTPTLLRHAAPNPFRSHISAQLAPYAPSARATPPSERAVRLLRCDDDALDRVVLALLYDTGSEEAGAQATRLAGLSAPEKQRILSELMSRRGPYDPAPRAFEASSITVELQLDYGAYRDLQRHRMLAPFTQLLGCHIGPVIPEDLDELGVGEKVREALSRAQNTWASMHRTHPFEAQYAVPLCFQTRTLWTLNLRELFHVVELRSARQGHASYRRVAQELYGVATATFPWLGPWIRVDLADYPFARGA